MWSSFDLQSRLWNILYGYKANRSGPKSGFIRSFLLEGSEAEAVYARHSTAYLFADYLGWAEIFRRDIQFLNIGKSDQDWQVIFLLAQISRTLASSHSSDSRAFRVFRINQRAIGELMIAPESKPGQRWCIGYAEFCRKISEDAEFSGWTAELVSDLDVAADDPERSLDRMIKLQNQLITLLDLLDPKSVRFPAAERTRFAREDVVHQLATER